MSKTAREIELEKKLEIAEKALTDVCLYRYDVSDTDQEDWFKIATCMAEVAEKAKLTDDFRTVAKVLADKNPELGSWLLCNWGGELSGHI